MARHRSLKRKRGHKYTRGRKMRPWLKSVLEPLHIRMYLYPRHLALMEALKPYVLADLQERFEIEKLRGRVDAIAKWTPHKADRPDILCYALEIAARKHKLDIEQVISDYISEKQQEALEKVLFGEIDGKTAK